jgi:hypothetical protein
MYDLNGKFCWIQESGTYSEGLVLPEYKNTHFVEIGEKFVGDESMIGVSSQRSLMRFFSRLKDPLEDEEKTRLIYYHVKIA